MSKAFDLSQFVGTPVNIGDGVVVTGLGSPFPTKFAPVAQGALPGVVVGASMPAANAQNQILISGPGPTFAWALGTNPAAAASVPPATAFGQVLVADVDLLWKTSTASALVGYGGACMLSIGGVFASTAALTFTTTMTPTVIINGGDPELSFIDNFSWDAGTF